MFERKDGICSVQATLDPSSWGEVATLPADCRPSERLVFNLRTHSASPARVDVTAHGVIQWVEGSRIHGSLSQVWSFLQCHPDGQWICKTAGKMQLLPMQERHTRWLVPCASWKDALRRETIMGLWSRMSAHKEADVQSKCWGQQQSH